MDVLSIMVYEKLSIIQTGLLKPDKVTSSLGHAEAGKALLATAGALWAIARTLEGRKKLLQVVNPFVPTVAFSQLSSNMCCPRDCVSWHNGGTSGAPLKPLRDDSALRALSSP